MKQFLRTLTPVLVVPALAFGLYFLVAAPPATAQSTGATAVVCREAHIAVGDTFQDLTCYYHTGGSFSTVPTGRYLHITHINISPFTGGATGDTYAFVYNSANSSILHKVVTPEPDTVSLSYNTPALIIGPGDKLVADNSGDHAVVVTATGFTAEQIVDPTALMGGSVNATLQQTPVWQVVLLGLMVLISAGAYWKVSRAA